MTDAPPPSGPPPVNPPPGWYPDPQTGGRGFRYWDGATWTDAWTDRPEELRQGLTPAGEWIGQVLRTSASRAGHLFPLVVLLIVPITLLTSFASWAAFRHGELTLPAGDVEAMSFTNPEANAGLYALVAIGMVVLLVAKRGPPAGRRPPDHGRPRRGARGVVGLDAGSPPPPAPGPRPHPRPAGCPVRPVPGDGDRGGWRLRWSCSSSSPCGWRAA